MKKNNTIKPTGLKGNQALDRMRELMGTTINESTNNSVVELTKIAPNGDVYGIVRENHEYYIKTSEKKSNLIAEDFNYIGGLQNKKKEAYPTYAKAIKQLNLKFLSINESFGGDRVNVFENDNLLKENNAIGAASTGFVEEVEDMNGKKAPEDKDTSGDNVVDGKEATDNENPTKLPGDGKTENTGDHKAGEQGHDEEIMSENEIAIDRMVEGLDPVGQEDCDVDNDGDSDDSDDYLVNKRLKIGKAIDMEESEDKFANMVNGMSDAEIKALTEALKKKSLTETKADGMSTGLFADEEDGYNIGETENLEETKFKLKVPTEEPSADDSLDGLEDFGGEAGADEFGAEDLGGDMSADDKPFDDEPFDAGVEADEESDPKTYIQQLAGKLGQSLRSYSEQQGNPDFDLEKFAVNSVLSATHTGEMDGEDQKDIIDKVKSSGNGDDDIDVNVNVDTGGDDAGEVNVDAEGEKTEENFRLGEGKTPTDNLPNSEKKRNFVSKDKIMEKLNEGTEVAPDVKPDVKPTTKPDVKPTRRQKPWRPVIQPKTTPKASGDEVLYEGEGSHGKIIDTKYLDDKVAIVTVGLDDNEVDMKFENTGEYTDKPAAYDEPWVYIYESVNSPDEIVYTVGVEFYGHPETNLDISGITDDYIQEK